MPRPIIKNSRNDFMKVGITKHKILWNLDYFCWISKNSVEA